MLDDLKMIHQRDTQDVLGMVERQPQQLAVRFAVPSQAHVIRNVICASMGGSAVAALMVRSWLRMGVPFEVVRGYELPGYVGADTLCIVASYSGDTEETVSIFEQAQAAGAQVVVVAHGGALQTLAERAEIPTVHLPTIAKPRFATWLVVKALAGIFDSYGLAHGATSELEAQQDWLAEQVIQWRPDVPTAQNEAKRIALELAGKSVVVQSGSKLWPAAYSWKAAINENAKHVAWASRQPEASHNEYLGWTRQPVHKPYAIIELRSNLEHPQTQKRFEVTERLLSGLRPAPVVVSAHGDILLRQLLYASMLGNFVSIYLALLGGIDPSSDQAVRKLKKEL